jgi:hypothetical protein
MATGRPLGDAAFVATLDRDLGRALVYLKPKAEKVSCEAG